MTESVDTAKHPAKKLSSTRAEMVTAGLTAFFSIAKNFEINTHEQLILLGSPDRAHFDQWKASHTGNLSDEQLDRLSHILGIYKALRLLFRDDMPKEWLRRPNKNPIFGGQTPMQHMLSGELASMVDVRHYLNRFM